MFSIIRFIIISFIAHQSGHSEKNEENMVRKKRLPE